MNAQTIAIHFANELCRTRALTASETEMLVQVVEKQRRRMWTAKDDRELRRLSRRMPAHVVAAELGRPVHSVRTRLRDLKRKEMGR